MAKLIWLPVFLLIFSSAAEAGPVFEDAWKTFFPSGSIAVAASDIPADMHVFEIKSVSGGMLGFVFRSDMVPPAVTGRRGEIGVLVAVDPDWKIIGIKIIDHREDKPYFDKIRKSFLQKFKNRKLDGVFDDIDSVTGATFSSKAIIKDVFLSGKRLLEENNRKNTPAEK